MHLTSMQLSEVVYSKYSAKSKFVHSQLLLACEHNTFTFPVCFERCKIYYCPVAV